MYRFVDFPSFVDRREYEQAVDRMTERLVRQEGVQTVYQIGGVSTPGVSDLDMVVVFDDGASCALNPLEHCSGDERYLFIHSLYGTGASIFRRAQQYSFFHNYRLLHGSPQPLGAQGLDQEQERLLKAQIAFEYLYKMYVNMVVQRDYGVFKLRSFLLHVKAVRYDLEFLGFSSGRLLELTDAWIDVRAQWFDRRPNAARLTVLLDEFFDALVEFLQRVGAMHRFYLPPRTRYRLARSLWLEPGTAVGYRRSGYRLPRLLSRLGRRYFNLQNRLNQFHFTVPVVSQDLPTVLANRFGLLDEMAGYNREYLPCFEKLTSSLHAL